MVGAAEAVPGDGQPVLMAKLPGDGKGRLALDDRSGGLAEVRIAPTQVVEGRGLAAPVAGRPEETERPVMVADRLFPATREPQQPAKAPMDVPLTDPMVDLAVQGQGFAELCLGGAGGHREAVPGARASYRVAQAGGRFHAYLPSAHTIMPQAAPK